jgi:hypothetical protein
MRRKRMSMFQEMVLVRIVIVAAVLFTIFA